MLLRRLSQLFHADVHAILDQIEDPQALLKQSVREMEVALIANRHKWKQEQSEYERVCQQLNLLESDYAKLDDELDLCLDADNEALAKSLVRRKLYTEKLIKSLGVQCAQRKKALSSEEQLLVVQQASYDCLRQKAEAFCDPNDHGSNSDIGREIITSDDVDIALLKAKSLREASADCTEKRTSNFGRSFAERSSENNIEDRAEDSVEKNKGDLS